MTDKPEPFLIKPQDKYAVDVLNLWLALARTGGVNSAKLARARAHREAMLLWQQENPDKVKVPD
jgi:hypothetical protein